MQSWTFYPAFVATFISITGWCHFVHEEHDHLNQRALSELGAVPKSTLAYFRTVLWVCGPLFAITMFAYLVPRIGHPVPITLACLSIIIPEIALGIFPAIGRTRQLRDILGGVMAVGMCVLVGLLVFEFSNGFQLVESSIFIAMTCIGLFTVYRHRIFVIPELAFIFLSHISILIAAIALR